jgi:hypothetical protein
MEYYDETITIVHGKLIEAYELLMPMACKLMDTTCIIHEI